MANIVDEFDYLKSCMPQGIERNKPYVRKNFNYINDINNGVYSNVNGLTLVQYDLTGIYNSSELTNLSDHFLIIPTVTCVAVTNVAAPPQALAASSFASVNLKTGNSCIIHQADLQIDGKTVVQLQPYSNIMYSFDQSSKMSEDDLKLHGKIKGYASSLDSPNASIYSGTFNTPTVVANVCAPGIVNNSPFGYVGAAGNNTSLANAGFGTQVQSGIQNFNVANKASQEKINWSAAAGTGQNQNNFFGNSASALMLTQNLNQELRPYNILNIAGTCRTYYDYLYIRLGDIFGCYDSIGLLKKYSGILRLYVNTGIVSVSVQTANSTNLLFNPARSTFTNTCPIFINNLGVASAYSATAFTDITAGFFIASVPNYTITTAGGAAVNFSTLGVSQSQLLNTRYYYSSILMDSLKLADYLASNQAKTIINKSFLYNTYTAISANGNFSQLIQSGVRNIKSVIVFPLISSSILGFNQSSSCFDPCGGLGTSPLSLLNFQVSLGGVQQLYSTLNYDFENFIEQMSIYNKGSINEYGVESGLLSYEWWQSNRVYMVNIRSSNDDDLTARNVTISFLNNSNVAIDILVYVIYEDEYVLNCATGQIIQKQ